VARINDAAEPVRGGRVGVSVSVAVVETGARRDVLARGRQALVPIVDAASARNPRLLIEDLRIRAS
jgi:hypothetical protein